MVSKEEDQINSNSKKISTEEAELTRKRLLILPKHELVAVLKRIHKGKRIRLQKRYEELRGQKIKSTKNIWEFLEEYGLIDVLIKIIIEGVDIGTSRHIESLYVEYQHGSFPTFYFISMNPPIDVENLETYQKNLELKIDEWNDALEAEELPSIRHLLLKKFENLDDEQIIEIELFYEYLIAYVSPEYYQPDHVYAHESAVIWLSPKVEFFIIKARGRSVTVIKYILRRAFQCKISSIQLSQKVIDEIFKEESLRSATFENPIKSFEQVDRHTVTDKQLSSKATYRRLRETSDRKRSTHEMNFLNSLKMAQVQKEGRIFINGKFRKSLIRKESIDLLKKIETSIMKIKSQDEIGFFDTKNPEDSVTLSVIKTKIGRRLLHDLAYQIMILSDKNESTKYGVFETDEYARNLTDYVISLLEYTCNEPECFGRILCPNCEKPLGGDLQIKRKGKIYCSECQQNSFLNIVGKFSCNHDIEVPLNEKLKIVLLPRARRLINQYYKEIGIVSQIPLNQGIMISHSLLELLRLDFTPVVEITELPSFQRLPRLSELNKNVIETQKSVIEYKLGEKCENYAKVDCRTCIISYHGNCVQRVVCHFAEDSRIWPHSAIERGDFEVNELYMGTKWKILGIAKASKIKRSGKKKKIYPLTRSNDERLLGQVLEAILYKRSNFIMIASGADLEANFKDMIETLCEIHKVKICFFLKNDLIRSYSTYIEEVKHQFGVYKQIY